MIRRAFTLIELLVVIAIIAILAAILFPVFAQAKLAAKQTASLSSVKQIMTGNIMYQGDADDQPVPYLWQNRGDGEWISYIELTEPYIKNTDIYINSAASTDKASYGLGGSCNAVPGAKVYSHYLHPMWISYNYWNWWGTVMFAGFPIQPNAATMATGGPCANLPAWASCTPSTQVAEPANTVVLVPGIVVNYPRPAAGSKFGWPCTVSFAPNHGKPDPVANKVDTRYQVFREGGNYALQDGHAKYYSSKSMNGNASRPHQYGGGAYPSSPHMVVIE